MVEEVVAFTFAAVVMLWAFRSAAYAFSGSERSGRHELAPGTQEAAMPDPEQSPPSDAPHQRVYQALLYLLALGVLGAMVAMLVGSLLA